MKFTSRKTERFYERDSRLAAEDRLAKDRSSQDRTSRDPEVLTNAIDAIDLPALVADAYPNSGARPGTKGLVRAEWRGDQHPSFSLYKNREGVWLFKDHATGDAGNAWQFLTVITEMDRQEAAELILRRVGANPEPVRKRRATDNGHESGKPNPHPLNCEAIPVPTIALDNMLWELDESLSDDMLARGFLPTDAQLFQVHRRGQDTVLPIFDPRGVVVNVKRKLHNAAKGKYFYEFTGHGNPAWCNPRFLDSGRVLVIEGELNAMIATSVMRERLPKAGISIMGVAGANASMHAWALKDREVYIYADGDEPGQKARQRWADQAKEAGAESVHVLPPSEDGRDFCDVAGKDGREALYNHIAHAIRTAQVAYGNDDRLVGYYTIRELNEATDRYMDGKILIPSGFRELDLYTQGLPESGIVGIGALPSMGKSVYLRDVLLNYIEADKDHKVMLFSPDQSVASIMRLLTSRRSGIPAWRVRAKRMTPAALEEYGSHEAGVKRWREVYHDTVTRMTRRFLISEESNLGDVKREMLKAIDNGVTMFGGDYLQMFELETSRGDEIDGKAIKDFKKFCREHKVPMLFAVQLAKYKFDRSRRSGVPYPSDIEGSGKIFQQCEQFYMIYNYHLYRQEYDEKDIEPNEEYARLSDGGHAPLARIYVRKNKEGARHEYRKLIWDAEVPAFRDLTETVVTPGNQTSPFVTSVPL